MNCKKCNAELENGVSVCPACGEPVEQPQPAEEAAEAMEAVVIPAEEQSQPEIEKVEAETAEAEEAEAVETETGEENSEISEETVEQAPPRKKLWKLLLTAGCCALLLGVLVIAILYGMGVPLTRGGEGILYKSSYTVSDDAAVRAQDKVVAVFGDYKLTNAELQAHYFNQVFQFMSDIGTNYFVYNQPLDEQICFEDTGTTWQQYFLENAIENWKRFTVLRILAEEEGFVPDQTVMDTMEESLNEAAIEYGFESGLALIHADMGTGCTMESYLDYVRLFRTGNQFVDYKFAQWEPTMEELEGFYNENLAAFTQNGVAKGSGMIADVRHLLVTPEGEKVEGEYSEAQWAAARKEAEKLLDQWKKGEATEESFAALVAEYTDDTASASSGGLYADIIPGSNYVEEFLAWAIDENRQVGDVEIVKTQFGYHIMYYVQGEEIWVRIARENYLPEKLEALIAENAARWELKIRYRNIVVTNANAD